MGLGFMSWLRSNENEIISSLELQAEVTKAEDLEHEGDKITHNIYVLIDKTFVTPLDKEDIANLTGEIDQIIDYTDRFIGTLSLFEIKEPTPYMTELAKMLLSSSQEVFFLVKKLRGFKNSNELIRNQL